MNNQDLSSFIESYIEDCVDQMSTLQDKGDYQSVTILNDKVQDIINSWENEDEFLYIPLNFGKPRNNSQFEFW